MYQKTFIWINLKFESRYKHTISLHFFVLLCCVNCWWNRPLGSRPIKTFLLGNKYNVVRSQMGYLATRQMRLASNYSKVFEIDDIWIKFWFECVQISIQIRSNTTRYSNRKIYPFKLIFNIWIEIYFDSNSNNWLKID